MLPRQIKGQRYEVSVWANPSAPLVFAPDVPLPDEFARIKREPDVQKIRDALTRGEPLAFVSLGERGEHIRIK